MIGPAMQSPGEVSSGFPAPELNAFVSLYATLAEDQLDVAEAETEHVIQPNGVADTLRRKAMSGKGDTMLGHPTSIAHGRSIRQSRLI